MRLKYVNGSTETVLSFRALQCFELPETEGIAATSLRGRKIEHLSNYRRTFAIRVANDYVASDVMTIKDFWTAQQKYLEDPNAANVWIEVATGFGKCPIELVDGIALFPKASFELQAKEPS
jgi:hypothetical protein